MRAVNVSHIESPDGIAPSAGGAPVTSRRWAAATSAYRASCVAAAAFALFNVAWLVVHLHQTSRECELALTSSQVRGAPARVDQVRPEQLCDLSIPLLTRIVREKIGLAKAS